MEQAASGTQEVSANIVGVTRAVGETGEEAMRIVETAGDLARQSDTLRSEVEKFLTQVRAA